MSILTINNLFFSYDGKHDVLSDINLDIEAGHYITIIGHNGSGKSTLAKLIIGLLETKRGSIHLFEQPLNEKTVNQLRSKVGIVFQNPDNQFIGATVADDIAFGLENRRIPHEDMEGIIQEFAHKVKMEAFLDKEPSNLSGGQKQRAAIAGILAMRPDLIIFDEATAMLDPKGKREIRETALSMRQSDPHLTIISITHDIEEAYHSDEIIVLNEGKIVLRGSPEQVFSQKETLHQIDLDVPFIINIKDQLKKVGLSCDQCLSLSQLADYLCQ